jgi:GTP cyclohydrolase I
MVVMSALHGCEACRGVKVGNVPTITSWFMGVFKDKEPREEFMFLIQKE